MSTRELLRFIDNKNITMSTRGLLGFIDSKNNKYGIYNHCDSYPSGLLLSTMTYTKQILNQISEDEFIKNINDNLNIIDWHNSLYTNWEYSSKDIFKCFYTLK